MTWGFLWLMLALKIPLAALIYIVWWAIKQEPERGPSSRRWTTAASSASRRAIRRKPFPRHPRRGPHGDPARPAGARAHRRARARTRPLRVARRAFER